MRVMTAMAASLALAGIGAGFPAAADCVVNGSTPGATVVDCGAGQTGILQTDRSGATVGTIAGQPFVGQATRDGSITGALGGAPYTLQNGRSPTPATPSTPVPITPPSLNGPTTLTPAPGSGLHVTL